MVGQVMRLVAVVALACGGVGMRHVHADPCGPTFAYGNAGYGAGYSIAGVRGIGSNCGWWSGGGVCGPWWGGGCRPVWRNPGWCNPCWRGPGWGGGCGGGCGGGWGVGGWPDCGGGWRFGWPGFGVGGWCGSSRWGRNDSIFLAVPQGGGATFFSGGMVPFVTGVGPVVGGWPTNWFPGYGIGAFGAYPMAVPAPVGVGPQFGPAGVLPFLGAAARGGGAAATVGTAARATTVARARPAARLVNEAARRRAERLVAVGDRHLRAAQAGAPTRARAAADAYRRAASAAPDDPDIRVREALALVAAGDANGADAALARAVAIDGRLAAAPPRRGGEPADPVFGDRAAGTPEPLAARGTALLREIAGGDGAAVEWLAARWGDRWAGGAAAVASR